MDKRVSPEFENELRDKIKNFTKGIQNNHSKRVDLFYRRIGSIKKLITKIDDYITDRYNNNIK
jgi:hypothetical protein